jgi:hypothetical protein
MAAKLCPGGSHRTGGSLANPRPKDVLSDPQGDIVVGIEVKRMGQQLCAAESLVRAAETSCLNFGTQPMQILNQAAI